jgi:preprotein translocase subunit YajC
MFISTAWAQGGGAAGGGLFEAIIPLVLIFAVFYFLLIRPQQKKVKVHREMLGNIRRGDKVVTGGGIYGTVTKVNDNELVVQIAEAVKVRIARGTIAEVLSKTEPARPVKAEKSEKAEKAEKSEKSEKSSSDVAAS